MMAKEYKIQGVSHKIKNWTSQYGDFTTYYVQLEGYGDEAIQLNKKSDSPKPEDGDELYGEIQETEFGKKFKSIQRPQGTQGKSQPKAAYKDHSKDITLGMVWKVLIGIQGVPENDDQFAKFFETVDAHVTELIMMGEKLSAPLGDESE